MHVVDWSIIHSGRGLQWCCIIVLVLYTHAELLWRIEGRGSYLHQPVWQAWLETQGSSQQSEELHRTDLSSIQWHMIDEGSDNTLTLRWKHPIFFFFQVKSLLPFVHQILHFVYSLCTLHGSRLTLTSGVWNLLLAPFTWSAHQVLLLADFYMRCCVEHVPLVCAEEVCSLLCMWCAHQN